MLIEKAAKMTMESDIKEWVDTFLSKPNQVFNGLPPCPYAKQAILDDKVYVLELKSSHLSIKEIFMAELENLSYQWPSNKDVVVIGCKADLITATELSNVVEESFNILKQRGYVALEDHPDEIEQVDDVILNQGSWAIIFLQPVNKLNYARSVLQKKGYYENWSNDYYTDVVGI
jgi:hypothetical protein